MIAASTTPRTNKKAQRRRGLSLLQLLLSFMLGCVLATTLVLNTKLMRATDLHHPGLITENNNANKVTHRQQLENSNTPKSTLDGVRILVAVAAYDFSQLPHLEELLDGYFDLCASGAWVDVVIHSTVAYPIPLIDLLNSRLQCTNPSPNAHFSLKIVLKSPRVRLHLVDFHRPLFYENLEKYDLFIYTEDDIRTTPRVVAAYLTETARVADIVGSDKASDFNVGIVRYEYNFPPDIVINDKTRHATQNVTRVYWEHAWKPPIPKSLDAVPHDALKTTHVHMTNHHQGMFLATRQLLKEWKDREGCNFDVVRDRPGLKHKPSQPAEGTQRVWMSSTMLYGNRHCNVQQVLPMDRFGELTVLHLPNKNYRRVGKKGRLGGHGNTEENKELDGNPVEFDLPSDKLLTAMELHIAMRKTWPATPQVPYTGIQMVDEVGGSLDRLVTQRLADFDAYVKRGGVMNDEDMTKTELVE